MPKKIVCKLCLDSGAVLKGTGNRAFYEVCNCKVVIKQIQKVIRKQPFNKENMEAKLPPKKLNWTKADEDKWGKRYEQDGKKFEDFSGACGNNNR